LNLQKLGGQKRIPDTRTIAIRSGGSGSAHDLDSELSLRPAAGVQPAQSLEGDGLGFRLGVTFIKLESRIQPSINVIDLGSTVSRRFINLACHSSATSFNLNAMVLE
jgi:hypothetical protein